MLENASYSWGYVDERFESYTILVEEEFVESFKKKFSCSSSCLVVSLSEL